MWTLIRRAVLPVLLASGGIASLIYGARFHRVPVVEEVAVTVLEEQEIEEPLGPPEMFQPPPFLEQGQPPFPGPPPVIPMVKKKILVAKDATREILRQEPEPVLVLGATIGDLPFLVSGELRRTQSRAPGVEASSRKGLSLCPT